MNKSQHDRCHWIVDRSGTASATFTDRMKARRAKIQDSFRKLAKELPVTENLDKVPDDMIWAFDEPYLNADCQTCALPGLYLSTCYCYRKVQRLREDLCTSRKTPYYDRNLGQWVGDFQPYRESSLANEDSTNRDEEDNSAPENPLPLPGPLPSDL